MRGEIKVIGQEFSRPLFLSCARDRHRGAETPKGLGESRHSLFLAMAVE
jgi:hypothetical protein